MRTGDIVTLADGSYSMSLAKGALKHIPGIYHQKRLYRVLGLGGVYPSHNYCTHTGVHENDTILVDRDDPGFMLFTQERFCRVVTPALGKLPPQQLEIAVPRGCKGVRLILQ